MGKTAAMARRGARPEAQPPPSSLRRAWEENAGDWVLWARDRGDSFWRFHCRRFLELLPGPGRLTVDMGAGEGRLGRELIARGHRLVAVDTSLELARASATYEVPQPSVVGDGAALPLRDGCADLVTAFMSLQDIDDLTAAVSEAARLLAPRGRFCVAVVHPLNSAGAFEGEREDPEAPFVVRGSYFQTRRYSDRVRRNELDMTFHSEHRSLEAYSLALEEAGFVMEALREVSEEDPADHWYRVPLFLDFRAAVGMGR
jgi:SAM-dependent methyltransferase